MYVCTHTQRTLEFKCSSKYRWIQLLILFIIKFSISSPAWKKTWDLFLGFENLSSRSCSVSDWLFDFLRKTLPELCRLQSIHVQSEASLYHSFDMWKYFINYKARE